VPHYGSKVRVAKGDALRSEMARISCRVGPMPETNPDCWMKGLLSTAIRSHANPKSPGRDYQLKNEAVLLEVAMIAKPRTILKNTDEFSCPPAGIRPAKPILLSYRLRRTVTRLGGPHNHSSLRFDSKRFVKLIAPPRS